MASVTLRNENFDNVHLQVTVGDSLNGGENLKIFDQNVPQHWSYPFNYPGIYLFFRRSSDPNNVNSPFNNWDSPAEGGDVDICG